MGERVEAEIVSPHGFSNEALPEAEVVQQLIGEDIVIPGENLFIKPAAFIHHDDRIGRKNNGDGWMLLDEMNDSYQPARLICSAFFLFWSIIDGANQDPSEQDQDDDQTCMGDVVVLPQ